jgi:aspartate aminotransferase
MGIRISHRARAIKPSPTLTVSSMAKQMRSQGIDVINFGVGEPDFNTPEIIKEEAKLAIDQNFTRYTEAAGILELREAIRKKLKEDNNIDCRVEDIMVSPGAKAAIVNILMTICDPRDEVLIPSPYWVSYTSQVEMVDAFPILLQTDMKTDFKISAQQLEEMIETLSNPKALILNSPNNPTGSVYNKKELAEIADVCLRNDIAVISDEIYEKLIYDDEKHVSIASISPEIREISIVINGVSKAYCMTGWRLGWAAGPTEIIKRANRIQSHTSSCVNSITQKAAIVALNKSEDSVQKMRKEFQLRRDYLVDKLNSIDNISCNMPKGAFYAMPDVSFYLDNNNRGIKNTIQLCEYLLKTVNIAIVAGSAFGAPNNVRFSYANSMDNIREGLKRFEQGLASLLN